MLHAGFQEKLCFDEWDATYIYIYFVMNDIVVFIWFVLFEDLWVWISGMKDIYVYMYEMKFVVDVAYLCEFIFLASAWIYFV